MAQRNPDHDAWANAIVRHPRFAEIVEKTRDGSNATQDGSNATSTRLLSGDGKYLIQQTRS